MNLKRNNGSFRDNRGHVYTYDDKVFRSITKYGKEQYLNLKNHNILNESIENNFLIESEEIDKNLYDIKNQNIEFLLEHKKIPFITYPYEWSFNQLKDAAVHHLKFQIFLLKKNFILRDSSAYNIQFIGSKPIFIDLLSIDGYKENQLWTGYGQFCRQFLNPLILESKLNINFNEFYKGSFEGISSNDLSKMLSYRNFLSLNTFSHIYLHGKSEILKNIKKKQNIEKINNKGISKRAYLAILNQLKNWIENLNLNNKNSTIWEKYADNNSYLDNEKNIKAEVIDTFCKKHKPLKIIDLGCNTGDYSKIALKSGAKYAIGYDFDHKAIDSAYLRAKKEELKFLTLYLDASNPSSSIGWNEQERPGFKIRNKVDAVLALAFKHHLVIGKNIIMSECIDWITSIANVGLIEFVPKNDPTVLEMLRYREDIFNEYSEDVFVNCLEKRARIINVTKVNSSGRKIFEFTKNK